MYCRFKYVVDNNCCLCCSYVEGLAELVVQNAEDISRLYEQGNRVKKLASADKSKNASR
jgi:hypothetical protein